MRKLAFAALLPSMMLISACSDDAFWGGDQYYGWNDYSFQNTNVDYVMSPRQTARENDHYQIPRKYYVTAKDQVDYSDLNARIQKREQQMHSQDNLVNTTAAVTTTAPATGIAMPSPMMMAPMTPATPVTPAPLPATTVPIPPDNTPVPTNVIPPAGPSS